MPLNNNGAYDRSKSIFIGVTVTFIFATVFIFARIVGRFWILKHRKWDDYSIIIAWILAFGMALAIDFSTFKGLGRQESDIPASNARALLASEYAAFVLYNPAIMATKTSILIFYIRISKNTRVFLRWASYATLAVVNISGVILTFLTIFRCSPVRAAYAPQVKQGQCISIETIYLGSAPTNIATDLAILVLPIPVLTSMKLPRRQKWILVLTFLVGASVTVVDVVRIYYLQLAALSVQKQQPSADMSTSLTFSYNAGQSLLLSAIEVNVGIICACVPVMRPFLKRVFLSKMVLYCAQLFRFCARHGTGVVERKVPPGPSPPVAVDDSGVHMNDNNEMHVVRMAVESPEASNSNPSHQTSDDCVYSGFLDRPKCMLNMRDSESAKYCTIVTATYTLWAFLYALLFVNSNIPIRTNPTPIQSQGVIAASYGGRIIGPVVGLWVLRGGGFKATFLTSLGIFCVGTLMFWPSGSLRSFSGYIVSSVVDGIGISMLTVATYGFLTLCGPPQHAEFRVCLATGVKAIGTLTGGVLGQKVIFPAVLHSGNLIAVQWTYLASAVSTAILALCFHYMPIPEVKDSDLETQVERLGIRTPCQTFFGRFRCPVHLITLFMAVLAMLFSNGGSVCSNIVSRPLVLGVSHTTSSRPFVSAANYYLVTSTVSIASECLFAPLSLVIPSHALLLLAQTGSIAFAGLILLNLPTVNGTLSLNLLFNAFQAPTFPLIFAIGARGLGRWSKLGICLITFAFGLGATAFPFITFSVSQAHGAQYSFYVVAALFAAGTLFPLYLILFRPARKQFNSVSILGARQHDNFTRISTINSTTDQQQMPNTYSY